MDFDRLKHSISVARKMVKIGKNYNLSDNELQELFILGFNHDIGYEFSEKCINHKLSPGDFEFDKGGKTQQKMLVLPFLHELLYHNCMIGNFINSGIYIKADYFVGNTKAVLSVGFRYGKSFI